MLRWHNGLVYTAGGLSTDRSSHLCWVGAGADRDLQHQHVSSLCLRNLLCHQQAKTNHLTWLFLKSFGWNINWSDNGNLTRLCLKTKQKKPNSLTKQPVLPGSLENVKQPRLKRARDIPGLWDGVCAISPSLNVPLGESLQTSGAASKSVLTRAT